MRGRVILSALILEVSFALLTMSQKLFFVALSLTVVPGIVEAAPIHAQQRVAQRSVKAVEKMAKIPVPLTVRSWADLSRAYYERVLDPHAQGDSFPVVRILPDEAGFHIKSYLGGGYDTEVFSALLSVIGSKLVGLDPQNFKGVNYVERAKAWYDPTLGIYRHRVGERGPVVHADIYGYWPAIQGLMLAAQYPRDAEFAHQAQTTFEAFNDIARGCGCPDRANFDTLGWNFEKRRAEGRPEPMNRLGNAPSVAWVLMVGAQQMGNAEMLANARAAMQWYAQHPGRYEISHVMGPLTAARLNVQEGAEPIDMDRVLAAWFGDGPGERCSWGITTGTRINGMTCDGLDGAKWENNGFYAFTMGTLQGPAWLVPVVRYDQRYARAIARYALNAANSARLLQGEGVNEEHQDHALWKAKWDKNNTFFYEGLASQGPGNAEGLKPYARGDVVLNGWGAGHARVPGDQYVQQRREWFGNTPGNLALYMGSSVGFLGGIMKQTEVPGVLRWDCTATDWFHPPAYPTHLYYNPFARLQTVRLDLAEKVDLYNTVTGRFVARGARSGFRLRLQAEEAAVLVQVPRGAHLERRKGHLLADGIVIDYRNG